jgi:hypothetical protein
MGMFDSFIVKRFVCPNCRKLNQNAEFQTKVLDNMLNVFKQGKKAKIDYPSMAITIKDGKYDCLGSCFRCNTFFDGKIVIKNNVFIGVVDIKENK